MSLVLNTNMSSLQGQNALANTQNQQATTFERLSTGLRINSAKDDAGGLYLAQTQTSDIRGLNMATRNAGDGISMAQTAEGALDQIQQNLQRINELAIQSANGTYSQEARDGLQLEVDELTQEINRIVETTEFNGNKLLNSDAQNFTMQIGMKNDAESRIGTGIEDGILEGRLTNEDGTRSYSFAGATQNYDLDPSDVTNGQTADADVVEAFNQVTADEFGLALDGDPASGFVIGSSMAAELATVFNNAGAAEFGVASDDGETEYTLSTEINGITFTATITMGSSTDSAFDGNTTLVGFTASVNGESVTLGAADTPVSVAAGGLQNFGATNLETIAVGGTDEPIEFASNVDVFSANALVGVLEGGLDSTQTINISNQENAQIAIQQSRETINSISEMRAEFGAQMNRFEAVIAGNQTYTENLTDSRSRVQDADFAVETANLAKQQVLQQAGISVLGQANASSQAILGLL